MKKIIISLVFVLLGMISFSTIQSADAATGVTNQPDTGFSSIKTDYNVAIFNDNGAPLYDDNGNVIPNLSLANNTLWYTDYANIRLSDGQIFYRVATDEFVSDKDITTLYVVFPNDNN